MSPLDWGVVAVFAAAVLALGLSAKVRNLEILQFLAAGRSLTLPFFVATLVCTWYGGILGIGESVSFYGVGTWLLMGVPYYAFALIYAWKYAHKVREADQISLPERLRNQFGDKAGVVSGLLVFLLGVPAAHVLMLGVLTQWFTGLPLWVSVLISVLFGSIFLIKGGLLADVRVSVLAFILMYVGFAMLAWFVSRTQPLTEVIQGLQGTPRGSVDGGVGVVGVITFFILGAWTLIDPGFHQRAASAESPATARKGILVSVICWMVFDFLTVTCGLYALTLIPADTKPLLIFPVLAQQVLPDGLNGLFLAGVLGTILTAMVGYALVSGASLGRDIVGPKFESDKQTLWTRIGIVVSLVCAVGLALSIESVVALWYSWGGCIIGALLLPVSAAYGVVKLPRFKSWVHPAAMACAFTAALAWMIYGQMTGNPFLNVTLPSGLFGYTGTKEGEALTLGLGTLVPSLTVSGLLLLICAWVARDESERRSGS
jgi:solute:Na+ symporter, SSS family